MIWREAWYNGLRMDEIAEKIELRNRVMRRMYLQLTPEQRIERMRQLHEWGLQRFRDYPEGFANFVIGTGLSYTFEQYLQLTVGQRQAVIHQANRRR